MSVSVEQIARQVRNGERRAIARAISVVENESADAPSLLKHLFQHTGRAYRIGITGPPGAGKSTITNKLAKLYRSQGLQVGIIAVDPTSPFTGGALLGDRVRMTDVELDSGVFIRSMASRGSLGGLSKKAKEAADVLDAAGFDVILLETVGVGQSELDIARAADTTIVILVPESGDGIQAMKAGLMEIADFFVLNKSDRPGADQAVMSIKMILGFRFPHEVRPMARESVGQGGVLSENEPNQPWTPDILKTVASTGAGIEEVAEFIRRHRTHLEVTDGLERRRRARIIDRIREIIDERLQIDFWTEKRKQSLEQALVDVVARNTTPYDLAELLLHSFRNTTEDVNHRP